jgi:hypothetical protein
MLKRLLAVLGLAFACTAPAADLWDSPWTKAHERGPLSADETRVFMRELAQYVADHHLKRDEKSPQRGMVYEYFNTKCAGQHDQWIQGEALDTMHDGAWFAAALVNAHHATGDRYYRDLLTQWVLPFYLKMLNHSDTLFAPDNNNAAEDAHVFNREHLLQKGEKGFVPYWWDDGASVSLEMAVKRRSQLNFMGHDELAKQGEANPQFKLRGYSHGSSNHLAQDLAIMLQLAWLMLRDSAMPADKALAAEVAEAAKNLHQCRMNHHGHINGICAAHGLCNNLPDELKRATDGLSPKLWTPDNHYVNCLVNFKPGQRVSTPGFADDQQYLYYAGTARHGTLPRPLAFKLIYDAFTTPQLFRYYCDDWDVPPGLNRFDLHPYYFKDGKPEDYRSDRKGPSKGPRPAGSRLGPQNMVVTGWALQALKANTDIWYAPNGDQSAAFIRFVESYSTNTGQVVSKSSGNFIQFKSGTAMVHYAPELAMLHLSCPGKKSQFDLELRLHSASGDYGLKAKTAAKGTIALTTLAGAELKAKNLEVGQHVSISSPTLLMDDRKIWFQVIEQQRGILTVNGERKKLEFASTDELVKFRLERELGHGLRTWQALFKEKGYIPTGLGAGGMGGGYAWDDMSDAGGYAHLLSAAAQWLLHLEGKRDWEVHRRP